MKSAIEKVENNGVIIPQTACCVSEWLNFAVLVLDKEKKFAEY